MMENKEVTDMELHERIAVIRKAMGLTQEQMGEPWKAAYARSVAIPSRSRRPKVRSMPW